MEHGRGYKTEGVLQEFTGGCIFIVLGTREGKGYL